MDLIVTLNSNCNFACDFCSSSNLPKQEPDSIANDPDIYIDFLKNYIKRHKVNYLIINGGEPLLVPIDTWYKLVGMINDNELPVSVSCTSNLWEFYKNPDKWTELFTQNIVPIDVTTSFQYGTGRKLADGTVFTEELFRKVFNCFAEHTGKKPPFIAVINEGNEKDALKHIQLAKELGTTCRLNGMVMSGRAGSMYPFYKMWNLWLDIIEAGLSEYEMNSQIIKAAWQGQDTPCPFNSNCGNKIKCFNPDGSITRCGSLSDDMLEKNNPLLGYIHEYIDLPFMYRYLKPSCVNCRFCNICNSCHKRVFDIKRSGQDEQHCLGMKQLLNRTMEILGG